MPERRYHSEASWDDLRHLLEGFRTEQGLELVFHVKHEPLRGHAYLEVTLHEMGGTDARSELERYRYPLATKASSPFLSQLVHAAWQAVADYEKTPWNWTAVRRRRARGED